jgi:hypothetical protein
MILYAIKDAIAFKMEKGHPSTPLRDQNKKSSRHESRAFTLTNKLKQELDSCFSV